MDNIEIIVKANGKVVPLDTISTETFEKMKEATKKSEVDVTRITCTEEFKLGTLYRSWGGKKFRYIAIDFGMFGTMKVVNYQWIEIL